MPTVFLSYRRSDTVGEAGRLADTLRVKVGDWLTFRDVTGIPLGLQLDSVLQTELAAARTVLVLVGPTWLAELRSRCGQPDIDYLRVEVAAALATGKRVIPILLKGAVLPAAEDLPEDIRPLVKRQAMTMRDESWDRDADRLLDAIGRPYPWKIVGLRAVVAVPVIVFAVKLSLPLLPDEQANNIVLLRIGVFFLVGIYALLECALAYRYFMALRR